MALRLAAAAIALYGTTSLGTMNLGAKLMNQHAMDMWNFQQAAPQFLVNFASVAGFFAASTHYVIGLLMRWQTAQPPAGN